MGYRYFKQENTIKSRCLYRKSQYIGSLIREDIGEKPALALTDAIGHD
jgi:hypothetical protein